MLIALSVIILALIGLVAYLVHRLDRAVADGADRLAAVIDRLERTPTVILRPTEPDLMTPSEKRAYISEFEYDDTEWNEFVGAEAENEEADVQ